MNGGEEDKEDLALSGYFGFVWSDFVFFLLCSFLFGFVSCMCQEKNLFI